MSIFLKKFRFDPRKRYHFSSSSVARIRSVKQVGRGNGLGFKPKGLWYALGDAWREWCASEMPSWLTDVLYIYEITPKPSVLRIQTVDALKRFSSRYSRGYYVNWPAVAAKHNGIEIIPYQRSQRYNLDWYYPWDVASGCIWHKYGADIKLVAEARPGKAKR